MKLKTEFVTKNMGDTQVMVAVGGSSFTGVVRSNKTAAFIVDLLKEEITREQIVARMLDKYDASEEQISADVDSILAKLRGIGALDE
ncbi:MAG: PqqD family protein [Clostridia bacterium]|nr:PqqD family protein [Clostridia bacterium]